MLLKAMWSLSPAPRFSISSLPSSLSHPSSVLISPPLIHSSTFTLYIILLPPLLLFTLSRYSNFPFFFLKKRRLLWCISTRTQQWNLSRRPQKNKSFWLPCDQIMRERERRGKKPQIGEFPTDWRDKDAKWQEVWRLVLLMLSRFLNQRSSYMTSRAVWYDWERHAHKAQIQQPSEVSKQSLKGVGGICQKIPSVADLDERQGWTGSGGLRGGNRRLISTRQKLL